jgi:hypothetical protein
MHAEVAAARNATCKYAVGGSRLLTGLNAEYELRYL